MGVGGSVMVNLNRWPRAYVRMSPNRGCPRSPRLVRLCQPVTIHQSHHHSLDVATIASFASIHQNGASNSVISPQPFPRNRQQRAQSGPCALENSKAGHVLRYVQRKLIRSEVAAEERCPVPVPAHRYNSSSASMERCPSLQRWSYRVSSRTAHHNRSIRFCFTFNGFKPAAVIIAAAGQRFRSFRRAGSSDSLIAAPMKHFPTVPAQSMPIYAQPGFPIDASRWCSCRTHSRRAHLSCSVSPARDPALL